MNQITKREQDIIDNINALNVLEQKFLKYQYEVKKPEDSKTFKDFLADIIDISHNAVELLKKIQKDLGEIDTIKINNPRMKEQIRDIVKGTSKFYSVSFYSLCIDKLNEDEPDKTKHLASSILDYLSEEFMDGGDDDIFSDFHSFFDIPAFYFRRIQVGPIVSSTTLPLGVQRYFAEIKDAYAYGLNTSSIALCRSLLEMALSQKLSKGLKKRASDDVVNISDEREDSLIRLIYEAKNARKITSDLAKAAHGIRRRANKVIHLKDDYKKPSQEETLSCIWETIKIIEALYR